MAEWGFAAVMVATFTSGCGFAATRGTSLAHTGDPVTTASGRSESALEQSLWNFYFYAGPKQVQFLAGIGRESLRQRARRVEMNGDPGVVLPEGNDSGIRVMLGAGIPLDARGFRFMPYGQWTHSVSRLATSTLEAGLEVIIWMPAYVGLVVRAGAIRQSGVFEDPADFEVVDSVSTGLSFEFGLRVDTALILAIVNDDELPELR